MLAAPNAPACGMNFGRAPGAQRTAASRRKAAAPAISSLSRHWTLATSGTLTINDDDIQAAGAVHKLAGGRFRRVQSTAGTPVTLTR